MVIENKESQQHQHRRTNSHEATNWINP